MKKKILSIALALCLAFGTAAVLPESILTSGAGITASALQYGDFTYHIIKGTSFDGKVEINKYTGSKENVVIPETIDGRSVVSIDPQDYYLAFFTP